MLPRFQRSPYSVVRELVRTSSAAFEIFQRGMHVIRSYSSNRELFRLRDKMLMTVRPGSWNIRRGVCEIGSTGHEPMSFHRSWIGDSCTIDSQ